MTQTGVFATRPLCVVPDLVQRLVRIGRLTGAALESKGVCLRLLSAQIGVALIKSNGRGF